MQLSKQQWRDPNNNGAIQSTTAAIQTTVTRSEQRWRIWTTATSFSRELCYFSNTNDILGQFPEDPRNIFFSEDAVHSSGVCLDSSDYDPLIRYIHFYVY